jgi:glutamate/tyrosine decarboxylase-like PLP-dependent enzyme
MCVHSNGLDPTAFPSLLVMENAIVGAAARLLSAPESVVGNLTSGGTESLMLAVKAARDARPDIAQPELVLPVTAHAAFAKACSYLRVRPVLVTVSSTTFRPDPSAMAAAITPATVLVACSAPSYPHGVVDPVAEIASAAAGRGVRCHVDACFGGWTLPYLRRLGEPVPPFEFSVPGVTSVSVDLHKYAYCPKGVSVLLHRDSVLRQPQYFAYADWPGYTMVNPTVASTRPGGPIAAAFATLRHLGDNGYLRLASSTLDAVRALTSFVDAVPGLRTVPAESTVVCILSDDPALDLFVLADELRIRGWHTQAQLRYADLPRSLHLTVTAAVAPRVAEFDPDLRSAVVATRARGPVVVPDELVALASTADAATLAAGLGIGSGSQARRSGIGSGSQARHSGLGAGDRPLPDRQADINALLEACPVPVRERLLAGFLGYLQRPTY